MKLKHYQSAAIELEQFNEWSKETQSKRASDAVIKILVTAVNMIALLAVIIIKMDEAVQILDDYCRPNYWRTMYLDPKPQLLIENL